jgi:hypothetical protein
MASTIASTRLDGPGLFSRTLMAVAEHGVSLNAAQHAAERWRDSPEIGLYLQRAAQAPHGTADFVFPGQTAFLSLVRGRSMIGRIPRLRKVPLVSGHALTLGGSAYAWTTDGRPAPVARLGFSEASLPPMSVGGIVTLSEDLARATGSAAEGVISEELISGMAAFLDRQFADPAVAPEAGVSPGSITHDAPAVASTGDPAADLDALLRAIASPSTGIGTLDGVTLLMSPFTAAALSLSGKFPDVGAAGGNVAGIPVVTSTAMGDVIAAVHAPSILYADAGGIELDSAKHATLQLDSDPADLVQAPSAAPVHTSLWQNNLVGLKVSRTVSWRVGRPGAVHVVSNISY